MPTASMKLFCKRWVKLSLKKLTRPKHGLQQCYQQAGASTVLRALSGTVTSTQVDEVVIEHVKGKSELQDNLQ